MKPTHIEHIGIAVKNLDKAISLYENILGTKCYLIENVEKQMVKTAFLKVGKTKIELLEATSNDSPIAKFIYKSGEGIHHIAFAVDDVQKALNNAKLKGCTLINEKPTDGAENLKVGFLHPKSTFKTLIEFCGKY